MKEQIEEMAKSVDEALIHNVSWSSDNGVIAYSAEGIARELFDDGYRKQKEGEWISNELGGYKYAFYCSECGWVDGYPFNDRHKFCPNCGAKMKGGAE